MYKILKNTIQMDDYSIQRLSSRVSQFLWYKLWGNTKQGLLPDGYTQVDYIASSGTQYIDTGVKPNTDIEINMNIQLKSNGYNQNFFGSRNTAELRSSSWNLFYNVNNQQKIRADWAGSSTTENINLDEDIIIKLYTNSSGYGVAQINDESITGTNLKVEGIYNLILFGCNNAGTISTYPLKIKSYSVKRNGTLIQNFIPCYRKSDNEVGLYDTVNDVFYTNQGTGSFAYGNVVPTIPTPSAPVPVLGVGDRTENLLNYHYLFTPDYDRHSTYFDYYKLMLEPSTQYTFTTNATSTRDATTFLVGTANVMGTSNDGLFNGVAKTITSNPDGSIYIARRIAKLSSLPILPESDFDNGVYYIMLNTGSTPLPYEPYGYKIPLDCDSKIKNIYLNEPLHKINDYADILSYQDHNVVRKIKKRVFDGTENWSEAASLKAYRFAIKIRDATQSDLTVGVRSICTHFPLVATGDTYNVDNCYTIASDKSFICRLDGSVRLADFKSYLQQQYANGTPVTIWYVLANEETEQIKAPDILADKYTSITVDTEVQPSQVDFSTKGKKVPQPSRETVRMLNSANTANQVNAINSIDMLNQNEELMTSEAEPSDYLSEETKTELEEPIEKEQTKEVEPIEKEEIEVEPIEKEQSKAELEEPIEKEQTDFIIK